MRPLKRLPRSTPRITITITSHSHHIFVELLLYAWAIGLVLAPEAQTLIIGGERRLSDLYKRVIRYPFV